MLPGFFPGQPPNLRVPFSVQSFPGLITNRFQIQMSSPGRYLKAAPHLDISTRAVLRTQSTSVLPPKNNCAPIFPLETLKPARIGLHLHARDLGALLS